MTQFIKNLLEITLMLANINIIYLFQDCVSKMWTLLWVYLYREMVEGDRGILSKL